MTEEQFKKTWNPIFKDLFILEMANNHQGSVEHGLAIIREVAEVVKKHGVKAAIKLQYRQLDSFIHPEFVNDKSNKHIPRFLSTRLSHDQFETLVKEAKKQGLLTMCTPFDEASVDVIEKHGIDIIKIGSCSAKDKPLLKRVSQANKPIVCSVGGCTLKDIDYIADLFEKAGRDFAFMHCVAVYPHPAEKMHLNRIELFRKRYDVPIGFSTHEDPNDFMAVRLAVAKGAQLLERHVGKATSEIKLNAYSSTTEQLDRWIAAALEAKRYCGSDFNINHAPEEIKSLQELERGVYLKRDAKKGDNITMNDVFFAMPRQNGQMRSGDFVDGVAADKDYGRNSAFGEATGNRSNHDQILAHAIQQAKSLLREAKVSIGDDYEVELSHHYGVDEFLKTGLIMVNCMNREYCKKLLIQLPGQFHPEHLHQKKEETFQVLHGIVHVNLDGATRTLYPGDKLLVEVGAKHGFWTETGAVIEEISTRYEKGGSVYNDPKMLSNDPDARKTYLGKW